MILGVAFFEIDILGVNILRVGILGVRHFGSWHPGKNVLICFSCSVNNYPRWATCQLFFNWKAQFPTCGQSVTLLYHPVGVFSSFHTLTTLDFLREREHHNNPGCTSSKASIHTYHIKILGGEGSAAVQDVHWKSAYVAYCIILTSCAWLSLSTHTITHTFLPLPSSTRTHTRKPSYRVCLNCKHQDAVKKIEIWKLPRILIIILNRWVLI